MKRMKTPDLDFSDLPPNARESYIRGAYQNGYAYGQQNLPPRYNGTEHLYGQKWREGYDAGAKEKQKTT